MEVMKKCFKCGSQMLEKKAKTPERISYSYHSCPKCGEEIVDLNQLHAVAEEYRKLKKYSVKLSKWGTSLGLRIPKELAVENGLKENKIVSLIQEKQAIRIITK